MHNLGVYAHRALTDTLLYSEDPIAIHESLETIHKMFSDISSIRGDILQKHHDEDAFLESGVAISPHMAARCLFDPLRTVRFLRGIHRGIQEAFRRFPGERINIVYAGCGPYATLLLPLTTHFEPEQIGLTLIDVNRPSIDGVQRIINTLGLGKYIDRCIQTDAVQYQHPDDLPLHMVVSETMQTGLAREPQLAIMRNFLPQLHKNGIFIPEEIVVDAYLSSSRAEDIGLMMHRDEWGYPVGRRAASQSQRLHLNRIVEVNTKFPQHTIFDRESDAVSLSTIEIPPHTQPFDQFLLFTRVTIYDSIKLEPYDCELSFPLKLHDLTDVTTGSRIQFSYQFSHNPGLRYERISA